MCGERVTRCVSSKDLQRAFHSRIKKSISRPTSKPWPPEKDKLFHDLIDNNNNDDDDSSWKEERSWLEARRQKILTPHTSQTFDVPQQQADEESRSQFNSLVGGTLHSSNPSTIQPQQTRHARRLYEVNILDAISEGQVHDFFCDAVRNSIVLDPNDPHCKNHKSQYVDNDPIVSVYVNRERRFAFLEFATMEITSALLEFDGIDVLNRGKVKVKIKRPNNYNPALMTTNNPHGGGGGMANMPRIDTSKIGIDFCRVETTTISQCRIVNYALHSKFVRIKLKHSLTLKSQRNTM